jgi:hypothetical protein
MFGILRLDHGDRHVRLVTQEIVGAAGLAASDEIPRTIILPSVKPNSRRQCSVVNPHVPTPA